MKLLYILCFSLLAALSPAHDLGLTLIRLTSNGNLTHVQLVTPLSRLDRIEHSMSAENLDIEIRARLRLDSAQAVNLQVDTRADLISWTADVPASYCVSGPLYPEDSGARTVVIGQDGQERVWGGTAPQSGLELVWVGLVHILSGLDHLLFLAGLVLLGGTTRNLLGRLSAFTLSHGSAMLITALGGWSVSPRVVEPLVALSIVFIAFEVLRNREKPATWRTWVLVFGLGLMHGLAFANAPRWAGLPSPEIVRQLLLFSSGIEAGQFAVVAALCAVCRRRFRLAPPWPGRMHWSLATMLAMTGSFWCIQRLLAP